MAVAACSGCRLTEASRSREDGSGVRAPALAPEGLRWGEAPAGDVAQLVREALASAAPDSRRVVVYVGAPWCEPCRRFHDAAARGDLGAMFGNVTLLAFDLDRDGDRLERAGYFSAYIPLLALPGADGRASGRQVEGGIKGKGAVQFLASRLGALLAR